MGIDLGKARSDGIQDFIENGRWYEYVDAVTGEKTSFKIRPSTPKTVRAIQGRCEKWRRGSKVQDDDKFEHMLRHRMVADWKGITINEQPAECTQENIDTIFDYCTDLAGWIIDTANEAGREVEDELKAKTENFTPTSGAPAPTSS